MENWGLSRNVIENKGGYTLRVILYELQNGLQVLVNYQIHIGYPFVEPFPRTAEYGFRHVKKTNTQT